MHVKRLSLSVALAIVLFSFAPAVIAQVFEFEITDVNMSMIVTAALLDGESLIPGDEIGLFTEDGVCAGAGIIPEGFPDDPLGLAAWGAEQGQNNGFGANRPIEFRYWDSENEQVIEDVASEFQVGEAVFVGNGFAVLTLSGERGGGEQVPGIAASTDAIDFGDVRIGEDAEMAFSVTNEGNADLVLDAMVIAGDGAEFFSVNFPDEEVILSPNGEAEFTVTFSPEEEGAQAATLTISSNDPDNDGDLEISLNGSGEPALPPTGEYSHEILNYGNIRLGENRAMVLTVTNVGDETLTIDQVVIDDEAFSSDFEADVDIPSGEASQITVTFTPDAEEVFGANMTIHSNDPTNDGDFVVRLNGRGVNRDNPPIIAIEEEDAEYFFGYSVVGEEMTWRFPIMNEGADDLFVTAIESDNQVFSTDFNQEVRIRAGDRWFISVTFAPEDVDFYEGSLTISSNDEDNPEITVALGGVSGADRGTHFQWYIIAENHSLLVQEATLDGEALVEGDEVGIFKDDGLLVGGGVVDDQGRVGLTAFGDDPESEIVDGLLVEDNFNYLVWSADQGLEAWAVPEYIQGAEVYQANGFTVLTLAAVSEDPPPEIFVNRSRRYFGQVRFEGDEVAEWTFMLGNRGLGELVVASIESDLNEFTTDFEGEVSLGQNDQMEVTVTFNPTEEREYTGRLSINSNDPSNGVIFIDVYGDGVVEPRNPDIDLADNYYMGVHPVGEAYNWDFELISSGGANLVITNVTIEGDDAFDLDWDGNEIIIAPGEARILNLSFLPAAAQAYNTVVTLETNVVDRENLDFPIQGWGSESDSHFLTLNTGIAHNIIVAEAIIVTLQDMEMPLFDGDEIAAFTSQGVCAGQIVVDVEEDLGFAMFGDDPNSEFRDGFINGEAFSFMYWDNSTGEELECGANIVEGPEVFEVNANTTVELTANAMSEEPYIVVEPELIEFGPVGIGDAVEAVMTVRNIGGADLIIGSIDTDMQVYDVAFEQDEVVLAPGEEAEFTITFTPASAIGYEGLVAVNSNDGHFPGATLNLAGIGSEYEGYFVHGRSGNNHSILVNEIDIGGAPPGVDDEVAVFTPAGMCAGASQVVDPRRPLGLSAWGDDAETLLLIEGFENDEEMSFRFYDFGAGVDHAFEEVNVLNGGLNWVVNGFTVITLGIENIFSIVPVDRQMEQEGEVIQFDLELANAEGEFNFTWTNQDEFENLDNAEFNFADNVGHFIWQTGGGDAGRYELNFHATNGNVEDRTSVFVEITPVNDPPEIVDQVRQNVFGDDNEFTIQEDAGWVDVVDLDDLFMDPDGDDLEFYPRDNDIDNISHQISRENVYQIMPDANYFGRIDDIIIVADDQRDRDVRNSRSVRNINTEQFTIDFAERSVRSIEIGIAQQSTPRRDEYEEFTFDLIVEAVNDGPVIEAPEGDPDNQLPAYRVAEEQELVIQFTASDADEDALAWVIADEGGLPGGHEFVDNEDGTATFTWTPDLNAGRVEPYTPVFSVEDPGGEAAAIQVWIEVINEDRPPVIEEPADGAEINVDENVELIVAFAGSDPDEGDALTWEMTDNGGLPREAVFVDNGDGTATLTWTPTFNDAREDPYTPEFTLTDEAGVSDAVQISITVNNINRDPEQRQDVEAQAIDEDAGEVQLLDLLAYFSDADLNDQNYMDQLNFELTVNPGELGLSVVDNILNANPAENFNTAGGDPLDVTLTVTDDAGDAPLVAAFTVAVNSVNDAPDAFDQLTPATGSEVSDEENLTFTWAEAVQNEFEQDMVNYTVVFFMEGVDDTVAVGPMAELEAMIPTMDISEGLSIDRSAEATVSWRVWAVDSEFSMVSGNAPFTIILHALDVPNGQESSIPSVFYMNPSYPNPFNPETTINFGVPSKSNVSVTVWNMSGQKVTELIQGDKTAGHYSTVWNANGISSGIYIIKMQSGNFVAMQKAVLVR